MDKLSYALGLSMGHNFLGSGIKSLNVEDFAKGVEAVYKPVSYTHLTLPTKLEV